MSAAKITISIESGLLEKLDQLIQQQSFASRSQAIQKSIQEKISRMEHNRLARECAKLDVDEEQAMTEEGFSQELEEWPEY